MKVTSHAWPMLKTQLGELLREGVPALQGKAWSGAAAALCQSATAVHKWRSTLSGLPVFQGCQKLENSLFENVGN